MDGIQLVEVVQALKSELALAIARATDDELQFEAITIDVEFNVGVTKTGTGKGGINFHVFQLGAEGSYATETIQKVTISLKPTMKHGHPIRIGEHTFDDPRG